MKKLLQFNFLPASKDFALLVARVWFGLPMLWLHGLGKLDKLKDSPVKFADPFGIGPQASLYLAIFAEVICAALLIIGLFTRFAALGLGITMGVAFFIAHGGKLSGTGNGELAFVYLAGYVLLFLAGAGKYSADARLGAKV